MECENRKLRAEKDNYMIQMEFQQRKGNKDQLQRNGSFNTGNPFSTVSDHLRHMQNTNSGGGLGPILLSGTGSHFQQRPQNFLSGDSSSCYEETKGHPPNHHSLNEQLPRHQDQPFIQSDPGLQHYFNKNIRIGDQQVREQYSDEEDSSQQSQQEMIISAANTKEEAEIKSYGDIEQSSLNNLEAQVNQWQRQTKVYEDGNIEEERKTTEGQLVQTDQDESDMISAYQDRRRENSMSGRTKVPPLILSMKGQNNQSRTQSGKFPEIGSGNILGITKKPSLISPTSTLSM